MADNWGAFTKGLAGTTAQLPQLMMQAQALKQQEELKQDAMAQQRFQYGITLMGQFKNRPEQQAFIFNNYVRPALDRGKERGIITHDVPEITADMFGNDVVKNAMSELDNWTQLFTKGIEDSKKSGATTSPLPINTYYQKINDTIGNALKKVTDESDIKRIQDMGTRMKQETTPMLYGSVTPEEQPVVAANMTAPQQNAFGIGKEEKKPYKVGQILPNQIIGDTTVSLQVTGFDEDGMPTFRQVGGGPRYKPPAEGGVTPAEKKAAKEEEAAYKTAATRVSSYIAKTKEDRAKWYAALGKTKKGSEDEKKITAELENFDTQLSTAQATLDGLRNKEIDPKTVKFGKGSQESQGQFRGKVSTTITSELKGMKAGRYRVAGQEVQWDGTKVIQ
jgi:hypothetical protein